MKHRSACLEHLKTFMLYLGAVSLSLPLLSASSLDTPASSGSGSAPNFYLPLKKTQGKIAGGRYYGFGDVFSFEVPAVLEHGQIEDYYASPTMGGAAFFNDYGFFLKVEIDELIPEVVSLISKHPQIKEEILDALFNDVILVQMKHVVPMLKQLDVKGVRLANGEPGLFIVINYPEMSSVVDSNTGKKFDSKRGYLLFFAEDKVLMSFSLQDTLSFIPSVAEAANARLSERLLNHLIRYQSTFRMEEPPSRKQGAAQELETKHPV